MSTARVGRRLRTQVLVDAGCRCGYCRSSEGITGTPLEIEHVLPKALGGLTRRANLWASCHQCNLFKSDRVEALDLVTGVRTPLFNPREQRWMEHFAWVEGGAYITGQTPTGRATVAALELNRPLLVRARQRWIAVGWHPPDEE